MTAIDLGDTGVKTARIGVDVSRSLFELHGVNPEGEVILRTSIRRAQLQETFAGLPRCVIGLESCGTAHRWGQQLASLGHEVRLMPAHAVAPHREGHGSSTSTAQAICEALGRSGTPFTRVKAPGRGGNFRLLRVPAQLLAGLGSLVRREGGAVARETRA